MQVATNPSSAVPKKKKIRRMNEDNLDGLLDRKTLFDVEESSVRFKDYPGLANMLSVSNDHFYLIFHLVCLNLRLECVCQKKTVIFIMPSFGAPVIRIAIFRNPLYGWLKSYFHVAWFGAPVIRFL